MARKVSVSFESDDYSISDKLWDQFKAEKFLEDEESIGKSRSLLRMSSMNFDYLDRGLSPLMKAVQMNYIKTAFNLLLYNTDPNLQAVDTGNTALHIAVENNNVTMVKALLAFDANPTIKNHNHETPLEIAVRLKSEYGGTPDVKLALGMLMFNFNQTDSPTHKEKNSSIFQKNHEKENKIIIELLLEARKLRMKTEKYFAENPTLSEPQESQNTFLLSLDGGGMRILITAQALINIEERMSSLSQSVAGKSKKMCSYFDYIAGTSSGGMTACLLAYLKVDAYNARAILSRMTYVVSASPSERKDRIDESLQDVFGKSKTMAELEPPQRVIVTASLAHITPFELHLMTNYGKARNGQAGPEECKVWEACHISGAAPVYSPLLRDLKLLDGGLVANNPTLDGMSEIIEQGKREGKPVKFGCVVSIGTGTFPKEENSHVELFGTSLFSILNPKNVQASKNLLTHFMKKTTLSDGQEVSRAKAFCDALGCPYFRLTPPLSTDVGMSTTDEEILIDMLYETQMYFFDNPELIDGIAKCLLSK